MTRRILIVLLLVLFALPTLAQEATDEPPTVTETPAPEVPPVVVVEPSYEGLTPTNLLFVAVIVGILVAVVFLGRPLIVQAGANVSAPVLEIVIAGVSRALQEAANSAAKTPTEVDNAAVAELQKQVDAMLLEIRNLRNTPPNLRPQ